MRDGFSFKEEGRILKEVKEGGEEIIKRNKKCGGSMCGSCDKLKGCRKELDKKIGDFFEGISLTEDGFYGIIVGLSDKNKSALKKLGVWDEGKL